MDSFQQSALKTSFPSFRNRYDTVRMSQAEAAAIEGSEPYVGNGSIRVNAIAREMEPLSNSFIRTAVAAE